MVCITVSFPLQSEANAGASSCSPSGPSGGGARRALPAAGDAVRQKPPTVLRQNMEESTREDQKQQALVQRGTLVEDPRLLC